MSEEDKNKKDFNIFTGFKAFRQSLPGYGTRVMSRASREHGIATAYGRWQSDRPRHFQQWQTSRRKPIKRGVRKLRKWRKGRRGLSGPGGTAGSGTSPGKNPDGTFPGEAWKPKPRLQALNKGGLVSHKNIHDMENGG